MGEERSFLTIETLISIALLMLYVLIAHALENKKVDFLHESGVAILMGALAGLASFTVSFILIKSRMGYLGCKEHDPIQ